MRPTTLRVLTSLLVSVIVLAATVDVEAQRRRRRRRAPRDGELSLMIPAPLEGAEVFINEESVGFAPLDPLTLPAGTHTVRVQRAGFTTFDDVVTIEGGQATELMVDMIALSMVLTVRSTPDEANVFVDGTFRGTTPVELELVDGDHELRIAAPLYRETTRSITAVPGSTDALEVTLEAIPEEELQPRALEWYEEPVTWVLVGSAVLAIAAVAVILAVVLGENALDSHCGPGPGRDQCLAFIPREDVGWTFDLPE
ncbi:MAG: PEGA domain-containing protein [Sandaracinaceae bacterium]